MPIQTTALAATVAPGRADGTIRASMRAEKSIIASLAPACNEAICITGGEPEGVGTHQVSIVWNIKSSFVIDLALKRRLYFLFYKL